jgi:hypothetical protein
MGKNTMGGKKAKKMKNSGPVKKDIIYPSKDQFYAIAEKFNSHSNIDLIFINKDEDGKETMMSAIGVMRGKIIKRIKKVSSGDIFIISKRDFETVKLNGKPKVDIIHKYSEFEKTEIMRYLHETLRNIISKNVNEKVSDDRSDDEVSFTQDNDFIKYRKSKLSYQNNTITTNYLDGFDLPSDSEEEY